MADQGLHVWKLEEVTYKLIIGCFMVDYSPLLPCTYGCGVGLNSHDLHSFSGCLWLPLSSEKVGNPFGREG